MSELAPQQPVEYFQQHPNAVQDQVKAEIMAYASAGQEETVVAERALALDAAANIGNISFRGDGNRAAAHSARHHTERAMKARETANTQAMGAAAIYDQVKSI